MAYEEILTVNGGTMQGPLKWNSNSLRQFSSSPSYLVGIEPFADGGEQKWASTNSIKVGSASAADSASKLSTARTVSGGGDFDFSFSYDGSANSTATIKYYQCSATVGNTNNYPFHRFAKLDTITASYADKTSTFYITQDYNGGGWGIFRISLRTNSSGSVSAAEARWLVRSGFSVDAIQIGIYNVFGETYADAFLKTGGAYAGTVIRNIASGSRGVAGRTWTLINSTEANSTTTSDKKTSSEVYATIAAAGTTLHNKAYSTIVAATETGTANYANSAGSAASAVKLDTATAGSATQPVYFSSGKPTACTYTLGKSVPSDANFSNTTYSAGTALSLSGTTFNHNNYGSAGTAGTSSATSGSTLAVPYVTVNAQGHVTGYGTHTHTISGFLTGVSKANVTSALGYTPCRAWTVTLPSGSSGSKAVTVSGATFGKSPLIAKSSGSDDDYNKITAVSAAANSLTFTLSSATSAALTLMVIETF